MNYGIKTRVGQPYAAVVQRVREALKEQGFGVLTEIDVKATLMEKLGVETEDFVILGACNPPLAHRALQADRQIGLLLPCNVVVRAAHGETIVEALDPQVMAEITDRPELKPIADEAARRIRAALGALGAEPPTAGSTGSAGSQLDRSRESGTDDSTAGW